MKNSNLVYIINVDWFFISHRLPLAEEAIKRGFNVFIVCKNTGKFEKFREMGAIPINLNFNRSGYNFFNDFITIIKLFFILKKIKPDIVHSVTLKVSIIVALIHKLFPNFRAVYAISGLGFIFTSGGKFLQFISKIIINFTFNNKQDSFIFQNLDDLNIFKMSNNNCHLIKGSGIDLDKFHQIPLSKGQSTSFIMVSRILKDKGVVEFCNAFKLLKNKYKNDVCAVLIGPIDMENPTSLTKTEISMLAEQTKVNWLGESSDIFNNIAKSDVAVLPSYREGLPKFLIEASALGRPLITTNSVGCKDCVIDGFNGILVPIKNVDKLFEAMEILYLNHVLRNVMGNNSRYLAVKHYNIRDVINTTFKIYS